MHDPRINRLFFVDHNKNDLVITVGDSWTWGDSLGDVSVRYRSDHVYGKYLSEYLDSDWINYGFCGGSNNNILKALNLILQNVLDDYGFNLDQNEYNTLAGEDWPDYDTFYSSVKEYPNIVNEIENFITPDWHSTFKEYPKNISEIENFITFNRPTALNNYKELSRTITKKYQNIYLVITLTETGRDSDEINQDRFGDVEPFLINNEIQTYQKINKLKQRYKNLNVVVGRNFSRDFDEVKNSLSIEKNWIQINFEENQKQGFNNLGYSFNDINKNGAVSGIAFNVIKKLKYKNKKQYMIDQIDNADKLWSWLRNNPLNYNKATCHPTEESHKLWADYLISYFK